MRFRPRWWGLAFALAVCAVTVPLGNWQARRAEEKRGLAERHEQAAHSAPVVMSGAPASADALALKRLAAKGEFATRYTVFLDNKVYRGRPGYFVVTPLRIAGGTMHVLVNRGWIPAGARREDLPAISTPAGEVTVEGYGLEHAPRVYGSGGVRPEGRVWQGLAFDEFAQWSGLAVQPVFLQQHSDSGDGLVRDWPRPDFGIDKHISYSLQWYLIAALAVVIFLTLSFERDQPASG